jgi:hypothetical protein
MRNTICTGLALAALAGPAAPSVCAEEPMPSPVQQPGIPGPWESATPQPLPPLAEVLARPGPGGLVYGLYAWGGEYHAHRAAVREIGWRSVRIAGPFDDALMRALAEDGPRVMVTLENRLLDPARGRDRSHYATDEDFLGDCGAKMAAFLDRYGPGGAFFAEHPEVPARPITEIEIWNEPNFQYLVPPDGRPQAELEAAREALYVRLLQEVVPDLKARHPQVTVAGLAGGGMSAGDLRFVEHVHAAAPGLADRYDVLSTHPYVRPAPPEANLIEPWGTYSIARSIAHLSKVLTAHGAAGKPVWITEIGWPLSQEAGGFYATPAHQSFVTPLLQAAYLCRTYALALRLGVERVHVMFTTDTDHFNGGVFERDGSWRPAAHAIRTMIRLLPDPRLTGALHDGRHGLFAYTFAPGGAADAPEVIMAWNVHGPLATRLPVAAERVRITDLFGHVIEASPVQGQLTLTVGPCPVWIQPWPRE